MKTQLKNKRVLYLYTGNHSVHRRLAESIGADVLPLTWKIPKDYDVYISEGDYTKLSILKILGAIKKDQRIITLFSDPRLFYLNETQKLNNLSQKLEKISKLKIFISKFLINKLDGAICLSKFEKNLLERIAPRLRSLTHYPFIEEKLFKKLQTIKPRLDNKNILFIGNGPDWYYKGLDLFKKVAEKNPFIKFTVVGGGWETFLKNNLLPANIAFVGLKDSKNLISYIKNTDLYLHLGRGEAFGVSISEAMAAGIPCVVSDQTGAKEFIEKISPEFVIIDGVDGAKEFIEKYYSLKARERRVISEKFKKTSLNLEERIVLSGYKTKFKEFVEEIYGQ